jgi:hypothetical protein
MNVALVVGLFAGLLAGCQSALYQPKRTRYVYEIRITEPILSSSHSVENDEYVIDFQFFETEISFRLRNKTKGPLTIFWDSSRYVTETGTTRRIFHKGVRVRDRYDYQPPTVVSADGVLNDHVVPSENVVEGIVRSGYLPILPVWDYEDEIYVPGGRDTADQAAERRRTIAAALNGRIIGLNLAMKIGDREEMQKFRFLVKVIRQ